MNSTLLSLLVLVLLALALVGAVVLNDLLARRDGGGVNDAALRRARQRDEGHESPRPPIGFGGL